MKKTCLILVFLLSISSVKASEIKADPTLIITTLDGKNFNLKEKRGKVVIINFWAKWCVDCRKEMLILDEIYKEYKSRNLEIIGINIGRKREYQKILEVSSSLSYPNAMFYEAKETSFEEPNSIPISYIIDKEGKLVATLTSGRETGSKKYIEELLKPLF
jgi:thiol-disulfide isomerase/thioredoxin